MSISDSLGSGQMRTIEWSWTANGAGAVTSETTTESVTGLVMCAETNPGSTAPTGGHNVTVTNAEGTDVLNGAGAGRSATLNELAFPTTSGLPVSVPVRGTRLTFNLTGNAVANAVGKLILHVFQPRA